jgi:AAHS family 3-hydroxyphenylpropionic acid transporter
VLFGSGRAPTTLLLWGGFFFTQLILLLMLNWLPSLLIGLGFSYRQAIQASVCFGLSGSIGAVGLARLHGGANRRVWVATTYAAIVAALTSLTLIGKNFEQALLASALAGLFIIGAQLILFALAPQYYSVRMQGTGVGAAVAIGRLGSVLGPLYAGALLSGGGNSETVLLGILPFVAIGGAASVALTWRKFSS